MKGKKKVLLGVGIAMLSVIMLLAYFLFSTPNVSSIERFESLPQKPEDFDAYTREIWKGAFVDLCDLEETYWQQPEFYGNSWKVAGEKFYNNPDYKLWGVYGQGNIPREVSYSFKDFKKGDEFELCTFFHNGFGVWTYQGFKLVPVGENEYFDIQITPNEFMASPTFPVFESGWAKKINIKIIVKETPPKGTYTFGFDVSAPSNEFSREATKQVLQLEVDKTIYFNDCMKFLGDSDRCEYLINLRQKKYVEGGGYQTSVRPFTASINIE